MVAAAVQLIPGGNTGSLTGPQGDSPQGDGFASLMAVLDGESGASLLGGEGEAEKSADLSLLGEALVPVATLIELPVAIEARVETQPGEAVKATQLLEILPEQAAPALPVAGEQEGELLPLVPNETAAPADTGKETKGQQVAQPVAPSIEQPVVQPGLKEKALSPDDSAQITQLTPERKEIPQAAQASQQTVEQDQPQPQAAKAEAEQIPVAKETSKPSSQPQAVLPEKALANSSAPQAVAQTPAAEKSAVAVLFNAPATNTETTEPTQTDSADADVSKDPAVKSAAASPELPKPVAVAEVTPEKISAAPVNAEPARPMQQQTAQPAAAVAAEPKAADGTQDQGSQSGQQNQQPQVPTVAAPVPGTPAAAVHEAHPTFARHLTQAGYAPAAEQVMVHIRNSLRDGSSRIQIQLEPLELGKVEIRLDVAADGKTGVTITTETRAAMDALQRDARTLERALGDAGLKTDSGSLSFNLRGEQQDQQQQRWRPGNYPKSAEAEEEIPAIGSVVTKTVSLSVSDGLDISI